VQVAEVIRQVQKPMIQQVQRSIPRITTQVVEKVQAVPATLINEVAMDLPQIQTVEVLKQTTNCVAQRIVQTSNMFERAAMREEVVQRVDAATIGGVYEAGVVGVRENVLVQPTVVERVSPIMTESFVGGQAYGGQVMETYAAPTYATYGGQVMETIAAPTYATYATYATGGQVMETYAAPTYATYATGGQVVQTMAAPTYMGGQVVETIAAPTYIQAAPTYVETFGAPTYMETIGAPQVMYEQVQQGGIVVEQVQPAYETVVYQQ